MYMLLASTNNSVAAVISVKVSCVTSDRAVLR